MITPTEFSSRLNARPVHAAGEFDHFAGHHAGEAPHPSDAVADLEHATHFAHVDARLEAVNLLTQYRGDLVRIEFHECSSASAVP